MAKKNIKKEKLTIINEVEGSNIAKDRDTMSLNVPKSPEYGEVNFMRIHNKKIIVNEKVNPLLIFKKSPRIMNMEKFNKLTSLQNKIDQVVPILVKEINGEFHYLGDIETLRSVEDFLKSIGRDEVWCAVIAPNYPDHAIPKLWAELNLANSAPDPLYRLFLYRHHIKKNNVSKKDLKKFMGVNQSNGKEAKQIDRDYSICSSDIIYELVTGIPVENEFIGENYWTPPSAMKAKISYTQAISIVEILGRKSEIHLQFKEKLEQWIQESQQMELVSDTVKPLSEREWYHKSKPTEIAQGVSGQLILPSKLSLKEQLWSARLIDENNRLLRIPELTVDLKKKDEKNIALLFEFYIKAASLSRTIKAYLNTIKPPEHGDPVRGRAADDDSSLELRSNMSEFYNQAYLKEVFHFFMLRYSNPIGFLNALGLSLYDFGFESHTKPIMLKTIRKSFSDWKILNAKRFLPVEGLPYIQVDVLSSQNILNKLSVLVEKHVPNESTDLIGFDKFFHQIFSLTFKEIQKEWRASIELTK